MVVGRTRTTSSEGYQATRNSSPHAAAATRRFLTVNASTASISRTAGEACCFQTALQLMYCNWSLLPRPACSTSWLPGISMHAWVVIHSLQRLQVSNSECGCCNSQGRAVSTRAPQATLVLPTEQHA